MPREGVPYPERLLCSLRCELKNIWNALSTKLHSINGVGGDGQGNVTLIAGHNITLTPDAVHNEITIDANDEFVGDAGTDLRPIKIVNGAPVAVTNPLVDTVSAQTVGGAKTFTGQMLATGQRAYSAANTTDIATIGTLDAYSPMVRTTNDQSIAGIKTFTSNVVRKTGLPPTPSAYLEATLIRATRTDDAGLGAIMAASGTESQIMAIRVNNKNNSNYYVKLFIRIKDNGRCDLIMESSTNQGYEQHIIYTFGTD